MDYFTLAGVAAELRGALVGARVQKVQQPSALEVVLTLHGRSGTQRLLLSADPQAPRLHLTFLKRESPIHPPAFCQIARKLLDGAWLESIALPYRDRIVRLGFRAGDGERVYLVAELMGRNANVILTSGAGTVRAVLRPIAADSPRPLRPNAAYADPPGAGDATRFGKFVDAEIAARGEDGLAQLLDAVTRDDFAPHAIVGEDGHTEAVWAFAPRSVPAERAFPRESLSVALETFVAGRQALRSEGARRESLRKAVARETAHREKALADARRTLAEAERAGELEEDGNLLLGNLGAFAKGDASVTVDDWYGGGPRTIALDPKKTPQENAESRFERARKVKDAADFAEGRAVDLEDELEQLAALSLRLESADDDAIPGLEAELAAVAPGRRVAAPPQKRAPSPFDGHKVRTYDLDGWTLLVGENADANDHLLTRVASPGDLWMHVRAGTGAHGVLRTNNHPERVPDPIVRRAAAAVAAKSGSTKHSGLVAVDVTQRRYVRKPRGAKAGLAMYSQAKTYDVRPELP